MIRKKIKLNTIAGDAIVLTIGKFLTLGIALVNSMLLSRFRTLSEYGTFNQITTIVGLVSAIFVFGLPNCINYFIGKADNDDERDLFLCTYYKILSILSFLAGITLFVLKDLISKYYSNPSIANYWFCLLFLPWATMAIEGVSNMLVSVKKSKLLIAFNMLRNVSLLLVIVLIKVLKSSFFNYLIFYVIVDSFFAFLVYVFAARIITKYRFGFNIKMIKSIFVFSIPMGLSSILSTLNIRLDHLVVGSMFSVEEYAIFSNAATELPFYIIAASFTAVLIPRMVKLFKQNKNETAVSLWKEVVKFNAVVLFFCNLVCLLFAPYMIKILYSDKYISGFRVFQIYSFTLLFRITYFGIILNAKGKPKYILISSFISLIVNLSLNYLFAIMFGIVGPALATVIAMGFVAMIQLILSARLIGYRLSTIFPWKFLITLLLFNFSIFAILNRLFKYLNLDYSTKSTFIMITFGFILMVIYFTIWFKPLKNSLKKLRVE